MPALTEEQLAVVQRLTNDGHTAQVIAELANAELGTMLSRNAICGLWNRGKVDRSDAQIARQWGAGIRSVNSERRIQDRKERRAAKKVAREQRSQWRRSPVPLEPVDNPLPSIDDMMIPAAQRRTLFELTPRTCRWPVGEPGHPDFFFCGAEPTPGSSYCAGHYHRSTNYVRPEPFRRAVNLLAEAAE